MDITGLIAQRTIVLPILSGAHATLSAGSSMGQLLTFEATVAPVVSDIQAAIKARRVSRTLQRALPILSEASALIAGEELAGVVDEAQAALRVAGAEGAFNGTAMAQAVVVLAATERARLACAITLDLCEALGYAPNGKPLRAALPGAAPTPSLFDAAL